MSLNSSSYLTKKFYHITLYHEWEPQKIRRRMRIKIIINPGECTKLDFLFGHEASEILKNIGPQFIFVGDTKMIRAFVEKIFEIKEDKLYN